MANLQYKICSFCKSLTQSEAYKLDAKNFSDVNVIVNSGDPLVAPIVYNVTACKDCRTASAPNNPIANMQAILDPAKANDEEIYAANN
ncbi:MAG: hypothetical protein PHX51_08280 [Clostridia bacterium]|nr:hypothetical protein [Clostridia bacterium]